MMEIIECRFHTEEDIMRKVAIVLCMGGNDFIPKYYNISHKKMLSLFLSNEHFRTNLLQKTGHFNVNKNVYKDFIKALFTPKSVDFHSTTYEATRRQTIYSKGKRDSLKNAKLWLPPESALERIADLIDLQIKYLETAGHSMAKLPNFLEKDCLRKTQTGDIEYHFGPNAREDIDQLKERKKRQMKDIPQKGKKECSHPHHLRQNDMNA
jgi:hypothetical protein